LLQAPLVLPVIEGIGLDPETVDGLVSLVTPLAFGWLVGRLREQSRAHGGRLAALLDVQRSVGGDGPLGVRLAAVTEPIRRALGADRVVLVLSAGAGPPLLAGAPPSVDLDPRSAVGWTLRTGEPVSTHDLGTDARFGAREAPAAVPVRGLVLPLRSGEGQVGALAIEWAGDIPTGGRLAAAEAAMYLGLGVENARLALRQQSFARELEDKVAAATERLRDLDRAKSEFLSVVSHELRTPLTALQGFSELLLTRDVPTAQARRFLTHLHHEAERLGRIVSELLDLSRIEAGRPEALRYDDVDLDELVERNVELFAAAHARHRFEWIASHGRSSVRADRDALDRILKNLLSNAVKYSPHGGPVRVTVTPADDEPGTIELSVADEGVGIPREAWTRIFDKYVRVPNAETASARGLGLGLSLVKALVEAHGGRVDVESAPGRGSRFSVRLPARKP
jgi:signal transduction histidine kinase